MKKGKKTDNKLSVFRWIKSKSNKRPTQKQYRNMMIELEEFMRKEANNIGCKI